MAEFWNPTGCGRSGEATPPIQAAGSPLSNECLDGPGDQLDRNRGNQQPRDTGQQLHAAGPQDPQDYFGIPHKEPEHDAHCDKRHGKRDRVRRAMIRRTKSMVATIAPGPVGSGVPSGTNATFAIRRSASVGSCAVPQQLQRTKTKQPARTLQRGKAGRRGRRINWPKSAKPRSRRMRPRPPARPTCCVPLVRPLVRPRKIGTVPGGSVMTNRVTKTSQKNFTLKNLTVTPGPFRSPGGK